MNPEEWVRFFREIGSSLKEGVTSLFGQPEARREIQVGAGGDTTTFIDQWAEDLILSRMFSLHTQGVDFTLVSEELGYRHFGQGDDCVLVDPIDGSLNAKRGIPFFAASFALVGGRELSQTRVGVVINLSNGDEFCAIRGKGSFFNGRHLPPRDCERMEVLAYEASNPAADLPLLFPLFPYATRSRCLGSTALDLCYAACGHIDLFVVPRTARCFDFAAGKLILEEAGGVVTDLEGNDLGRIPVDLRRKTSLLASSSPRLHQQAREILGGGSAPCGFS